MNSTQISTESFSEFEKAYGFYSETVKHHNEITTAINSHTARPLIVTEGSTDWKHLKAAYNYLKTDDRCSQWINSIDFEFLEYEPQNTKTRNDGTHYLQMGGSNLEILCKSESKLPNGML